jgi:dienelactone hydrolase
MTLVRRGLPLWLAAGLLIIAFSRVFAQDAVPMTFEDQVALFDYDTSADLAVTEIGTQQRADVTVKDIEFTPIAGADPVSAYLIVPEGEGPFAGILWVHWLGEEHASREQFLDEAVALAPKGAVSLLVNAMWSQPDWYSARNLDEDYQNGINQVIALRRAMDLLVAQPNVDAERLGFVGHDYGGMYGTIFAGVDHRAKGYVFVAVTPSLLDWAFFAAEPASRIDYIRQNVVLEPILYLPHITNASILFQFARNDIFVGVMKGAEYHGSAPDPKERLVYDDADHSMTVPKVAEDRDAWLITTLGLTE